MPNPKVGTVTFDVGQGGARAQGRPGRVPRREGRHRPRADRQGVVRRREAARERRRRCIAALVKRKPATAKGNYVRSVTVSTTMGPGVEIDPTSRRARRRRPEEDDA